MKRINFLAPAMVALVVLSCGASFGSDLTQGLVSPQDAFARNAKNGSCVACKDRTLAPEKDLSPGTNKDGTFGLDPNIPSVGQVFCSTRASEKKMTPDDLGTNDGFGVAIAISGDYAIVGAPYHQHEGMTRSGSAYMFKKEGDEWIQQVELLSPYGGSYNDDYGFSVSISGDYAVVGAPLTGTYDGGAAYVFKRQGSEWLFQQQLYGVNIQQWDRYGMSVSISGNTIVVGSDSCNVHVYKQNGESWDLEAVIVGDDGLGEFGHAVSIAGDDIVVGAPYEDDNGQNSGSAYVFKREGTSWTQQAKLLPADGNIKDYFGSSVSIKGDYVLIGASFDDDNGSDSGSAYIFKRDGTSWNQWQKLIAPDGQLNHKFGESVSIGETYAAIGAPYWHHNSAHGAAYIYKLKGTSWGHKVTLTSTETQYKPCFGQAVSILGSDLAVGASIAYFNTAGAGAAYHYKICNGPEYLSKD